MPEAGFHFAAPWWLLLLLAPALSWLWLRATRVRRDTQRYQTYADEHLLPLLLGRREADPASMRHRFVQWTLVWTLLVIGLAAPRWDYVDMQLFRPGSDVIILFDLSRSMDVDDIKPSRLVYARREVEDLILRNRYSRIGLIGFATVAHVISPLTEDRSSLQRLLPALSTDLVRLKGSRVSEALARARQMLAGQPVDSSRHLILVTDGDFEGSAHFELAKEVANSQMHLHVIGIGTTDGSVVLDRNGSPMRHPRYGLINSKLNEDELKQLAIAGNGIYLRAESSTKDTQTLLAQIKADSRQSEIAEQKTRVWREQFHWVVILAALLMLPLFRRGGVRAPNS